MAIKTRVDLERARLLKRLRTEVSLISDHTNNVVLQLAGDEFGRRLDQRRPKPITIVPAADFADAYIAAFCAANGIQKPRL